MFIVSSQIQLLRFRVQLAYVDFIKLHLSYLKVVVLEGSVPKSYGNIFACSTSNIATNKLSNFRFNELKVHGKV